MWEGALSAFDWAVIAFYAVAVLALGRLVAVQHGSAADLLVGRRSIPTWAVLGSMVATELSAATFLGVPDAAWGGTWSYLELAFGALAGKALVSLRVIPLYHRLGIVSLYELLAIRFGRNTQRAAALCFVAGRLLASGVRLFIAALAFSAATDTSVPLSIVGCGVVAGLYTRSGGIRSVIFTDILQAVVFLLGAVLLVAGAAEAIPGGLSAAWDWARASGRTQVFTLSPFLTWTDATGFGTAFVGGFFLTLATHGTDFDMVQRLLTARDGRAGGRALLGSALLNFPITLLFLGVGTAIAAASALGPEWSPEAGRVVPDFAMRALPAGLRGLVFAGLLAAAMSSLDSAICAIATSWNIDVAGLRSDAPGIGARLQRTTVLSSVALVACALAMAAYHEALAGAGGLSLVEFALSAMTILYGGLLGIFAVAIAMPGHGSDTGAVRGLAVGAGLGLLLFLHPVICGQIRLAWTWWIPLSASAAAVTALLGSRRPDTRSQREIG